MVSNFHQVLSKDKGGLAEDEALPHFHPTSDLLLWTSCHLHMFVTIHADVFYSGFLYDLFFTQGIILAACAAAVLQ